jgi:hypothetical protein
VRQAVVVSPARAAIDEPTAIFCEYGMPFYLAITLTEHGEWLVTECRASDANGMCPMADAH